MDRFSKPHLVLVCAVVLGLLVTPRQSLSQATVPSPASPAPESSDRPAFHSEGINASIAGISVSPTGQYREVLVQVFLKDARKEAVEVAVLRGQAATGASTNGVEFYMDRVAGFSSCEANDQSDITRCMANMPAEQYIYLEPDGSSVASLHFSAKTGGQPEGSLSFVLRLLVRGAAGRQNSLASVSSPHGPAHVVTINFPLVPLVPPG